MVGGGEATKIIQGAEAYRERSIAEAKGAASRFDQVYAEYKKAPDVIRPRMFIDTMEKVLTGSDKLILDQGGTQNGVVPYLPLAELGQHQQRRPAGQNQAQGQAQQQGATR